MKGDLFNDRALVTRLQTSDELAFNEIYNWYWPKIYARAFIKTHSKEISEEIVQDIFMSLWVNRTKVNIKAPLENYLFACLRNKLINFFKANRVRESYITNIQHNRSVNINFTEQTIEFAEIDSAVKAGLHKLPDRSYLIFSLSRFKNLSNRQISLNLKISEKAVEYHITKSIRLLRFLLKDYLLP